MSMISEFKEFAMKGNVVDLAVGIVIGVAFGKIVSGLVNDFIMPFVALATPGGDWRAAGWILRPAVPEVKEGDAILHAAVEAVTLKWGDFLGVTLDFVIVAIVLFLVVKAMNKLKPAAPPPPPAPETKECPGCLEQVAKKATRCKFCTTDLATAK